MTRQLKLAKKLAVTAILAVGRVLAFDSVIQPLGDEKWWGGVLNDGASMPYENTKSPIDLSVVNKGGTTSAFLVSSAGRYVWSDRPFVYAFTNGTLYIHSSVEKVEPVQDGSTLKEAYLAASRRHFPFDGRLPAELLFTMPQWNNWVEIAIQGMNQKSVDDYTDALARSGFPCGVYMMDGGWLTHQGSFRFYAEDFPDPRGMFDKIRRNGWKSMIWIAHMISPDSREAKLRRFGPGYMIDGRDVLAYRKDSDSRQPGIMWWWSGASAVWDLTYEPGRVDYLKCLVAFAAEYGIDGYKFDAGDVWRIAPTLRFHDPKAEAVDYSYWYNRIAADNFPYNEIRCGFRTGGLPVMQRLHDQRHSWESLRSISALVQVGGLIGSPYVVADMIGGGDAETYRPGSYFSEKLFLRSCALQALQPMMQFSAAPWRYLSKDGVEVCRAFANLHVAFGPYILEVARHAAKSGEPIVRSMEYAFPHCGYNRTMTQYMLGDKWLVAPVTREDDSLMVELPKGLWKDDLGGLHTGPKSIYYDVVPMSRLPRFMKVDYK